MSPEQTGTTAREVDTRSDIYSLGVLLYELLVGALPFDPRELREAAALEIVRMIREDEPPKPTTKISRLGDSAQDVARRRHTNVRTLTRQLRGELDWITMRALEKDPARRYPSASEFAADIGRHLADEPVLARPPGFVYRARTFTRRYRIPIAAAALVVAALIIGFAATAVQYIRVLRSEARARHEAYVANMRAAESNLRSDDVREALAHLAACDPELRGWEWRHMMHFLTPDFEVEAPELKGRGSTLRFMDHGRALGANAGTREFVWRLEDSARMLEDLAPRLEETGLLATAPNGGRVLISRERSAYIVSRSKLESGRNETELLGLPPNWASAFPGQHFGFSQDGAHLYHIENSKERDLKQTDTLKRIHVFDAESGQVIGRYEPDESGWFIRATIAPGGRYLASCAIDRGEIKLWEQGSLKPSRSLPIDTERAGTTICERVRFSPSGDKLLAAIGNIITVLRTDDGAALATWEAHRNGILAAEFNPSGDSVATAGFDRMVKLWELPTASADPDLLFIERLFKKTTSAILRFEWHGPLEAVSELTFDATGDRLAALDLAGRIVMWRLTAGSAGVVAELGHKGDDLQIDPEGKTALVAHVPSYRTVQIGSAMDVAAQPIASLVDLETGNSLSQILGQSDLPDGAVSSFVPGLDIQTFGSVWSGRNLRHVLESCTGSEQVAHIWNYEAGRRIATLGTDALGSIPLLWLPDDQGPGVAANDLRPPNVAMAADSARPPRVATAAFFPDEPRAALLLRDRGVMFWNWESGEIEPAFVGEPLLHTGRLAWQEDWDEAGELVFDLSGRYLAAWAPKGIAVWDLVRRRVHSRLDVKQAMVDSGPIAWSPDSRRIAGAIRSNDPYADDAVILWRVGVPEPETTIRSINVDAVAFSPDGSRIAIGGIGGVRIHDASGGDLLFETEVSSSDGIIESLLFTPDGRRLVVLESSGKLFVLDTSRAG